jgi:hypothetical protein
MGVVEKFLENYAARDWDGLAECFSEQGFERVGPYVDVISSADEYLDFLRRVVPILREGYALVPNRIVYVDDHLALAELTERLPIDGTLTDIPEAIVFGLDGRGKINHMRLYLQQPGGTPPVGGKDAVGRQDP